MSQRPPPTPRSEPRGSSRRALAAIIGGALLVAWSPILVRLSELEPTATAFYRMGLALPLLSLLAWLGPKAPTTTDRQQKRGRALLWVGVSGIFFAADLTCWHLSIEYTTVANATLFANGAPLFVTLAAWLLFGERIRTRFLLGLVLAVGGATLLVRGGEEGGDTRALGDLLGVATALFYAGYIISVKAARRTLRTPVVMAISGGISALLLAGVTWVQGEAFGPISGYGWAVLLVLAWLPHTAGQGLVAYGLAHLPASFTSLTLLIQPVAAACIAWLMFGEALGPLELAGGIAVLTGIRLAQSN